MYCAHCGKQNADNMLFCGFCGKPLNTKDETPAAGDSESRALYGRPEPEKPQEPAGAYHSRRDRIYRPERVEPVRPAETEDLFSVEGETDAPQPESQRHTPVLNRAEPLNIQGGRAVKTVIPRRETPLDGDNLFMDEAEPDEAELDALYDERAAKRLEKQREQSYEEALRGGFFARHIRGIVSLSLMALVAIIIAMWAYSAGGQRTLAQLNLSRQPESYARLAESYAKGGSREMEGYYYSRALHFDPDNANYAVLMANAYIAANNTAKATEALTRVIELQPDNAEAYALLSQLYPVAATRPEAVRALIQQGYQRTGDSRLSQ